eukprot:5612383-Pleurochrysis_carterae.AAC.2
MPPRTARGAGTTSGHGKETRLAEHFEKTKPKHRKSRNDALETRRDNKRDKKLEHQKKWRTKHEGKAENERKDWRW